jgi:GNAT superfamily N-acetyltransferase
VVTVTELGLDDVGLVDSRLPLNRLDQHVVEASTYLIAWNGEEPVGHAHLAWRGTHLRLPEIQDMFVLPELREQGIGTTLVHAAEQAARDRGWERISLSVSRDGNPTARRLYERLGYTDAGVAPVRTVGVIQLRGQPFHVDDTLLYLTKTL